MVRLWGVMSRRQPTLMESETMEFRDNNGVKKTVVHQDALPWKRVS